MNLSDPSGDDDLSSDAFETVPPKNTRTHTSSDEYETVPSKRTRLNTYGASSTTSQGSGLQESDDESPEPTNAEYSGRGQHSGKALNYAENSPEDRPRVNRSSLSENCSSPNYDDYHPSFEDIDHQGEGSMRPSFQDTNDNTFYNKNSTSNEMDGAFSMDYSEKSKRMMISMGYKPVKGLGKFEHGRIEPVEASTQKGRRGLGLKPSIIGEVPKDYKWSPDDLKPEAKEEPVSTKQN